MNLKALITLGALAVIIFAAAMLLQPRTDFDPDATSEFLLPGLLEQANDVHTLSLHAGGGVQIGQFSRVDGLWISANPAGYPADWEDIRGLIQALAGARISEPKTSNPDYYERLGVRAISDPEAIGIRVDISSELTQWSAIIGKNAESRQGQYMRVPDAAASVLVDQEFDLSLDPVAWLEQVIIDLPASEVKKVSIKPAEGQQFIIEKEVAEQDDYVLKNVPDGRTVRSGFTVNGIAGGLAGLEMQGARALEGLDFGAATVTRFETFDSRVINAELLQQGDEYWLRISAALANAEGADSETEPRPEDWVSQFNATKATWAFSIPQYKYTTLSRTLEDLLEPAAE